MDHLKFTRKYNIALPHPEVAQEKKSLKHVALDHSLRYYKPITF
jgi:hypothetical protein